VSVLGSIVSREEGEAFAKKHNLLYFESSAKSGEQVEEAFLSLATTIFDHLKLDRDPSTLSEQELRKLEGHGVKVGPKRPVTLIPGPSTPANGNAGGGSCC
jgi:hypothetical protein